MSIKFSNRAQSPAEFIIVVFLFFIILIALFTAFITKLHPEIEKAIAQKACINANGLATYLLKEPGIPADWSASNLQVLGLTNGTEDVVSYDKWLAAEGANYIGVRNKTVPDTSFLLSYAIFGFNPAVTDNCPSLTNGAVICRAGATTQITASSSSEATLNLKLFFPHSTAAIENAGSLESNDTAAASSSAAGTTVTAVLRTSASDSDAFDISFSPAPLLVYIQIANYKTAGTADTPIFVGNTSAVESFGSPSTGANNYCAAERAAGLAGTNGEVFPARFRILTW